MAGQKIKRCVITAGPTREAIDPVRFISNRSSGKMGYSIASAFKNSGWHVTLVSGPAATAPPDVDRLIHITGTEELYCAVRGVLDTEGADILVMCAAVCDFAPSGGAAKTKIKKTAEDGVFLLKLVKTRDILESIKNGKNRPFTVGFCAETDKLLEHAVEKLRSKDLDIIIANDVSAAGAGMDSDYNSAWLVTRSGVKKEYPLCQKKILGEQLAGDIIDIWEGQKSGFLNKT